MQASTNYIYIIFAVLYVIYSVIKASKKAQQKSTTQNQKPQPSSTVQPPTASPLPKQKPEDQEYYDYISSQIESPENQQPNIQVIKIHNMILVNDHKIVKVETIRDGIPIDLYFFEKDSTSYVKVQLGKFTEDWEKHSQEIDAIISLFKFIKPT